MISVLVPFSDNGCLHRIAARGYVLGHYTTHHGEWELVEGSSPEPWSKGRALAEAADRATGSVLVLADADSFTDPSTLAFAVELVASGEENWVVPHRLVRRLDQRSTDKVLAGGLPTSGQTCRHPYTGVVGGGITVLTRQAWDTVGGIDPRFEGWGGEDIAFGWALETLVGPYRRLDGPLWHLWHKRELRGPLNRGCPASEALAGRYRDANGHPEAMSELVAEHERSRT